MAERRMFAKTIIDSDAFLDMPLSAQALYFHLAMRADDDGFINNPKKIQRMLGCGDDSLKLLIAKLFIIPFESGIVVIKHWKIHNFIRTDRYKESIYQEEKNALEIKNKTYEIKAETDSGGIPAVYQRYPDGIQTVSERYTQVRLGKDRLELGQDRLDKEEDNIYTRTRTRENTAGKPTSTKKQYAEFVKMTEEEYNKLIERFGDEALAKEAIEVLDNYKGSSGKTYKSDYRAILTWVEREVKERHVARPIKAQAQTPQEKMQGILDRYLARKEREANEQQGAGT